MMRRCYISANGVVCGKPSADGAALPAGKEGHPLTRAVAQRTVIFWYMKTCPVCEAIMADLQTKQKKLPDNTLMVDVDALWREIRENKYTELEPLVSKVKWVPQTQVVPSGVAPVATPNEPVTLRNAEELVNLASNPSLAAA